jgi:small-conductance mechanosensitive channel
MDMQAKDVFKKVLKDSIRNIIFYGIGTLAIAFIGNAIGLRIVALIMAGIFVVIVAISLIPFLISFFVGIIGLFASIAETNKGNYEPLKKQGYLWAGTLVQLVENLVCLYYISYLYNAFFG